MLLFWTWDTVCNRIIDRTIFEEDLKNLDPTTPSAPSELRFCSPFLVNAVLAVSCVCRLYAIVFTAHALTNHATVAVLYQLYDIQHTGRTQHERSNLRPRSHTMFKA